MVHGHIYTISTGKDSPKSLMSSLRWKAHMSVGAQQCACSGMTAMWSHDSGDHVNLCCDVISVIGKPDTTIIKLGRLYFMLSYWLTPTDVTSVQHGRRAAARPQTI
jgi:hypothetical protein